MKTPFLYASLLRFPNLLLLFLSQICILSFLFSDFFPALFFSTIFFQLLSTLLITAAGYVVNDLVDQPIDLINKPQKTFIDTHIPRPNAWFLYTLLNFFGIFLGFWADWRLGLFHAFCALLLWLYSFFFKKMLLVGNFCVALLAGISSWELYFFFPFFPKKLFFIGALAAGLHLLRETIKDYEDREGDRLYDCRTLAVLYPLPTVKKYLYGVLLVFQFLLGGAFMAFSTWQSRLYLVLLFFGTIFLFFQIKKAQEKEDFSRLSFFCKIGLGLGLGWLGV